MGGREEVSGGDREDRGWRKCEGHQEGLLKGGGMGWVGGGGGAGVSRNC